ncbi:hypothetical protein ABT224_40555 [Streptomyces sp. NPDC001584]|uniref:hypothetical protein n=1 Tax=Streptomyces sp. NPDC001584 TaxID=3154521 RepID=UPI003333C203
MHLPLLLAAVERGDDVAVFDLLWTISLRTNWPGTMRSPCWPPLRTLDVMRSSTGWFSGTST